MKIIRHVKFWYKIFTTRQILVWKKNNAFDFELKKYNELDFELKKNASDFEMKKLQRVRFWTVKTTARQI